MGHFYVIPLNLTNFVQHKARIRATNKKDREEMEKELYNLRRHSGLCPLGRLVLTN